MRDAIVYGYDIAENYINRNGDFDICRIYDMIDREIVKKLMEYCDASKNQVLEAIQEGIERACRDYKNNF